MVHQSVELDAGRQLALALTGSAVFGAAAALGYGMSAAGRGAWMAPALFVGGAVLAAPPLFLFGALAGGRLSARELAASVLRSAASVGTALLGLAAPAAFFSVTMKTRLAPELLVAVAALVGLAGVIAVARSSAEGAKDTVRLATVGWCVFAVLLGARLMTSLGHAGGLAGGVS
jgi:hypothetical protein